MASQENNFLPIVHRKQGKHPQPISRGVDNHGSLRRDTPSLEQAERSHVGQSIALHPRVGCGGLHANTLFSLPCFEMVFTEKREGKRRPVVYLDLLQTGVKLNSAEVVFNQGSKKVITSNRGVFSLRTFGMLMLANGLDKSGRVLSAVTSTQKYVLMKRSGQCVFIK